MRPYKKRNMWLGVVAVAAPSHTGTETPRSAVIRVSNTGTADRLSPGMGNFSFERSASKPSSPAGTVSRAPLEKTRQSARAFDMTFEFIEVDLFVTRAERGYIRRAGHLRVLPAGGRSVLLPNALGTGLRGRLSEARPLAAVHLVLGVVGPIADLMQIEYEMRHLMKDG